MQGSLSDYLTMFLMSSMNASRAEKQKPFPYTAIMMYALVLMKRRNDSRHQNEQRHKLWKELVLIVSAEQSEKRKTHQAIALATGLSE